MNASLTKDNFRRASQANQYMTSSQVMSPWLKSKPDYVSPNGTRFGVRGSAVIPNRSSTVTRFFIENKLTNVNASQSEFD